MTIEQAVDTLNKQRWANIGHWKATPSGEYVHGSEHTYRAEDAIAIASYLSCSECQRNRGE